MKRRFLFLLFISCIGCTTMTQSPTTPSEAGTPPEMYFQLGKRFLTISQVLGRGETLIRKKYPELKNSAIKPVLYVLLNPPSYQLDYSSNFGEPAYSVVLDANGDPIRFSRGVLREGNPTAH
jgi:hypothetical protein